MTMEMMFKILNGCSIIVDNETDNGDHVNKQKGYKDVLFFDDDAEADDDSDDDDEDDDDYGNDDAISV
ncbi:hypothetical protein RRG08_022081 [Elysia crispata]|uniref:Uncharacterized protein n=1 Tax=Elysia crispata TaxID=231223 RepID=A0AAE0Y258_9GAST|nr:hypothetical protein RRG08_022081 [Elysia crispata]